MHSHSLMVTNSYSAHSAWSEIASIADVVVPKSQNRHEFLEECKSGAFEGIGIAYRTFESVRITGRVDQELVKVLPQGLKFICHCGELAHHDASLKD